MRNANHRGNSQLVISLDKVKLNGTLFYVLLDEVVLIALADDENVVVGKESARNKEWVKISMKKHVNTEILKENQNLRKELKELTTITETWLNNSNKVNQCIMERPWLFEAKGFTLPNYDTADESSVCSTPLPPMEKLADVGLIYESKTIKSILKSNSTFKPETLKKVTINKPTLAPAKGNQNVLAFKRNSAPTGKLNISKVKVYLLQDPKAQDHQNTPPCIHYGFNDHLSDDYVKYPICDICGSYDQDTHGHNMVISLRRGIKHRNPQHVTKSYETCGSTVHTITDHNDIVRFRRGEALQAKKVEALKSKKFDEKRGTIFNSNKEIVMIALIVRDVYILDMTCATQESCFFSTAIENLNWLWHKRLAHLNFKIINQLATQNLVIGLPSLVYLKDKPCSSCEKGKHHRANFKIKQTSSIKKCLHLLHMDLFGPITPRSINHEKYSFGIVDEYSRIPNIDFLYVFGCPVYIHNHEDYLEKFDEKADDGYFIGYSLVSKAFRIFNTIIQQNKETYHINLMKALMLSNSQNLQMTTSPLLNLKDTHLMSIFIHINLLKAQDDEILNDDQSKHSNHNNDNHIIDNLPNTKDVQISKPMSSSTEDTSAQNAILIIIGNPGAGMLTWAKTNKHSAASAHECLFVDFLSKEEPKKVSEALKHPGWVDAMQ
uniref:Retrovirus-related Pol polyprotein from transposon TNT 1-94 n=1 Tax=Tanacetum cinerariifolium TaxID=118510 RepID=A0A6L2J5G7_TANCI|nr:retrovirus-related Pol polyprotein from transposon TNT 1-94 [Tanacetum cinerariifolium]